jgi:hypothetical protein
VCIGKIRNMDVVADACTIGWRQDAILNFGKNKSLACDVVRAASPTASLPAPGSRLNRA